MSGQLSVKQRLISALEAEIVLLPPHSGQRATLDWYLRELRHRGSGPLPYHLRKQAADRGIATVTPSRPSAINTEAPTA